MNFTEELRNLINRYSKENNSDTPDFILARYLENCLDNFKYAIRARDSHYGFVPWADIQK